MVGDSAHRDQSLVKTISIALKAHMALGETSLVTCLRLSQVNVGSPTITLGFTEHDKELIVDGLTFKPPAGTNPTDVVSSSDMAVDNVDVRGVLDDDAITADDVRAGRWDYATAELFMVNWADLTQGKLYQRYGDIGQISVGRGTVDSEVRGLMQRYSTSIGKLSQPGCRHALGDAGCQVDLSGEAGGSPSGSPVISLTVSGTIDSVSSDGITLTDSARTEESGFFQYGVITILAGINAGLKMEVKAYVPGTITLQLPFPDALTAGVAYSMHAGCDLLHDTCRDRFDNIVNFDGEWALPGNDAMIQVARSK